MRRIFIIYYFSLPTTMKNYQKQHPSLNREDSEYRKKYRNKLYFTLADPEDFWNEPYDHTDRIGRRRTF